MRGSLAIYALTPMIALSSNSLSLVVSPKGYLGSRKAGDRVQAVRPWLLASKMRTHSPRTMQRLTFEPV